MRKAKTRRGGKYVAFYSDTEYEVLKVTGGRGVTVTYNLYLADPASRPGVPLSP